jgi:hypothetical protein
MKLTIITSDKTVYVDGVSYGELVLSTIPSNIHALQWKESSGWIEFNDGQTNEPIDILPQWAIDSVTVWAVANTPLPAEVL